MPKKQVCTNGGPSLFRCFLFPHLRIWQSTCYDFHAETRFRPRAMPRPPLFGRLLVPRPGNWRQWATVHGALRAARQSRFTPSTKPANTNGYAAAHERAPGRPVPDAPALFPRPSAGAPGTGVSPVVCHTPRGATAGLRNAASGRVPTGAFGTRPDPPVVYTASPPS